MAWSNANDRLLKERARRVIPNGMYGHESTARLPEVYPQFFRRSEGAYLWDTDNNKYIDFMCAFGPNLFGYRHKEIERAAAAQRERGDSMTGPSEIMVDLAETLVDLVTHAQWCIFGKNGTDATTLAATIARAHTKRRKILVATGSYHGAAPWCTPSPNGVTAEDKANLIGHDYNNVESLVAAARVASHDLAAILVTPFRHEVFREQFLADARYAVTAREICDVSGALLIVDDVRAGFRIARDCSWATLGVQPDLSCWGKCLANGYPLSAVLGNDLTRDAAGCVFTTGSFWFQAVPMAAAIRTLQLIRDTNYLENLVSAGTLLREGLDKQATRYGFELSQTGPVQMPQILFADDPDFRLGYAWASECLQRGVYFHPYHNMFLSTAHTEAVITEALCISEEAFAALRQRRAHLASPAQLAGLPLPPRTRSSNRAA